ncbi:ribosomal-processing cysteine protease Prp [Fundicoccus culcitae]|uniref:Ribosomal processing cysteine protease Prp n=1 Tax=Fundicoccus culcitae TaxID=2969821 RepID=A0ABY5P658_9LACT|nr:ribosomal-processing cysteine protease Prp [Fundicoccus culcitae]UUX34034.1 ribosomal-processing cysteine protease Prp [Fundicoccus culcitae]
MDSKHAIKELTMTGHAGYADSGYDIVCAAVSSQVISVENSLEHLLGVSAEVDVDEVEGGYLKIVLPAINDEQKQHDVQLLMKHLSFALEILAKNYPEFIHIFHK